MIIDRDRWNEILETLSSNKLRTALTAFGVSWGIFMLIIMLGSGSGLENGVSREFSGRVSSSVFMWSRSTSIAYAGYREGRNIELDNRDTEALARNLEELDILSPGLQLGGWRGANNVSRKDKIGAFEINGYYPNAKDLKLLQLPLGRFLNDRDMEENRKVCVIGDIVLKLLFEPGEDPIGEYIEIQGVFFRVVGQFKSSRSAEEAEDEDRSIYIPFSTFQHAFHQGDRVHWFAMSSKPGIPASVLEDKAKDLLRKRHNIHPKDYRAIGSWNLEREVERFNNIFNGISLLSWIVGVLTLLAGVIGISNIMLIVVKERTREIGVRRAVGATPLDIVSQVILESILLTTLAGAIGFLAGVGLLENIGSLIEHEYFSNPEVNVNIALTSLMLLVVAGTFAGLIPAYRASSIKPVDALRSE